jgi:hypothetical protein
MPPASAGIIFDGDEGRLSEAPFLRDFAGDRQAKRRSSMRSKPPQGSAHGQDDAAAWRSKPSFYAFRREPDDPSDLELWPSAWAPRPTVKASHLSLISHPEESPDLILEAAGQPA